MLEADERCDVARIVTGKSWAVNEHDHNAIWRIVGGEDCDDILFWHPSFNGTYEQRSQALALVEWLADRITQMIAHSPNSKERRAGRECERKMRIAITSKDIPALLQLALEILENGNG